MRNRHCLTGKVFLPPGWSLDQGMFYPQTCISHYSTRYEIYNLIRNRRKQEVAGKPAPGWQRRAAESEGGGFPSSFLLPSSKEIPRSIPNTSVPFPAQEHPKNPLQSKAGFLGLIVGLHAV